MNWFRPRFRYRQLWKDGQLVLAAERRQWWSFFWKPDS